MRVPSPPAEYLFVLEGACLRPVNVVYRVGQLEPRRAMPQPWSLDAGNIASETDLYRLWMISKTMESDVLDHGVLLHHFPHLCTQKLRDLLRIIADFSGGVWRVRPGVEPPKLDVDSARVHVALRQEEARVAQAGITDAILRIEPGKVRNTAIGVRTLFQQFRAARAALGGDAQQHTAHIEAQLLRDWHDTRAVMQFVETLQWNLTKSYLYQTDKHAGRKTRRMRGRRGLLMDYMRSLREVQPAPEEKKKHVGSASDMRSLTSAELNKLCLNLNMPRYYLELPSSDPFRLKRWDKVDFVRQQAQVMTRNSEMLAGFNLFEFQRKPSSMMSRAQYLNDVADIFRAQMRALQTLTARAEEPVAAFDPDGDDASARDAVTDDIVGVATLGLSERMAAIVRLDAQEAHELKKMQQEMQHEMSLCSTGAARASAPSADGGNDDDWVPSRDVVKTEQMRILPDGTVEHRVLYQWSEKLCASTLAQLKLDSWTHSPRVKASEAALPSLKRRATSTPLTGASLPKKMRPLPARLTALCDELKGFRDESGRVIYNRFRSTRLGDIFMKVNLEEYASYSAFAADVEEFVEDVRKQKPDALKDAMAMHDMVIKYYAENKAAIDAVKGGGDSVTPKPAGVSKVVSKPAQAQAQAQAQKVHDDRPPGNEVMVDENARKLQEMTAYVHTRMRGASLADGMSAHLKSMILRWLSSAPQRRMECYADLEKHLEWFVMLAERADKSAAEKLVESVIASAMEHTALGRDISEFRALEQQRALFAAQMADDED